MRAELLMKQPPTYDDGAGMFERSPYAMPVSLFGKTPKPKPKPAAPSVSGLPQFDEAPADMQRRSLFGLKAQAPAQLPAVIPQRAPPLMQPAPAPAPAPSMFSAPLQDAASSIANKALNAPVTRRDILRGVGQAALQQVIPMPSVTDVVSPLAAVAKAMPVFDKNAIIGAVSSFLTDKMVDTSSDLAEELFDLGIWQPEDPDTADATTAWEYAQYGGEDHTEGLATLRDNFNLKKLSEHSGIPIEELKKHISDSALQSLPLSIGNRQESLSAIMEDGRPKEAYRMTALEDLAPHATYLKKAAKELYGAQKSFDDNELREIADAAHDIAYKEYVRKTMNSVKMSEGDLHDQVLFNVGNTWLKSQFKDVFEQAAEDWGYDSNDFYERAYDVFTPKP